MLRKTRESMMNSTLLFMERAVITLQDPQVYHRPSKHRFEYENGSVLAYGGMKDDEQREQIRGIGQDGGADIIWMEEANQFDESDYNELIARARAKAAPWRQILLSCNPDAPTHWIYSRLILGHEAHVYYSSAVQNLHNPKDYLDNLARMTGIEGLRLHKGLWVQATGLVLDTYVDKYGRGMSEDGDAGNVTDEAEFVQDGGPTFWAVDDGYSGELDQKNGLFTANSHPRVFLFCQLRRDGTLTVFNEDYAVHVQDDQHIERVMDESIYPYPRPDFAGVDKSAASLKGRLYTYGISTRNGPADVDESLKEIRRKLAPDKNGRRRILIHPRCRHLRSECASYVYNGETGKPAKQFDHGPDALRYLAWAFRFE